MKENSSTTYNIICLSNQLWDFPSWTNKRHVMMRLAQMGHTVLFVDPPINAGRVFFKQIRKGHWNIQRLLTQTKKDMPSNALVYTPINLVPKTNITSKLHISRIKQLSKSFDKSNKTVLWVYHVQIPHLENYIRDLDFDFLLYDCVDNYSAFPKATSVFATHIDSKTLVTQEEYLATKANVVFASAPGLVDKMKKYNDRVYFTPNVGDYEKFKDIKKLKDKLPEDIKSIKRPRIGFTGALDAYKFDYDLMAKIAQDHPKYNFVVIGPMALKDQEASTTIDKFKGLENIYILGSRDYKDIHTYFAGFDAYIIPYVLNDYTVGGCFPVKFHDALAGGLPVIVTDLPAYLPFSDVSYISHSYEAFSQNIKKALDEDSLDKIKARQLVAKDNNWDGKVAKMLDLIKANI